MQESSLENRKMALKEASRKARHALVEAATRGRPQSPWRQELEALKPDIMVLVFQHFTAREIFDILQKSGFPYNFPAFRNTITEWRKEAGLARGYRRQSGTPRPDQYEAALANQEIE